MALGSSSLVFVADADHLKMRVGGTTRSLEFGTPMIRSSQMQYAAVERGRIQDTRSLLRILERELQGAWSLDSLIGMSEVYCGVPGYLSPVECEAYVSLCKQVGARRVRLVSSALCALLGVGEGGVSRQVSVLLILQPDTAELAVVVSGQQTWSTELPISFRDVVIAIDRHIRRTYGMQIGTREFIHLLSSFSLQNDSALTPATIEVQGMNARTHSVKQCSIETQPLSSILLQFVSSISESLDGAVALFPAEYVQSLLEQGLVLFGSIPPITNIELLLAHHLQFPVSILPDAGDAVLQGLLQMKSHSKQSFVFETSGESRILGLTNPSSAQRQMNEGDVVYGKSEVGF